MTQYDDEEWLKALAGKDSSKPAQEDRALQALRDAIKSHNDDSYLTEEQMEQGLQKLKFRLRSERLSSSSYDHFYKNPVMQWAVAASIFISMGMILQSALHDQTMNNEMQMIEFRGSIQKTTIVVESPLEKLLMIEKGLNDLKAVYSVKHFDDGRVEVAISLSKDIVDFFQSQRIEVSSTEKILRLEILRAQK